MKRLLDLYQKPVRRVVGLMSGTSVDGIDAALVRIEGSGVGCGVDLLAFKTYPFAPELRERIHRSFTGGSSREVCGVSVRIPNPAS